MSLMRVFVDANVIVSGLLFEGNESQILKLGSLRAMELITTTVVLEEVCDALLRGGFGLERGEVENLTRFLQEAVLIVGKPDVKTVRRTSQLLDDKDDAHVWTGFEYAGADFLLTGDKELLKKVERATKTKDLLKKLDNLGF